MKSVMYDQASLTEMKDLYTVKMCNLRELANKFGGSTVSVRKALADQGVTVRGRGRVKGKAVGPRTARKSVAVATDSISKGDATPEGLEQFLNTLRKD